MPCSCTACPPTAARRSSPASSTGPVGGARRGGEPHAHRPGPADRASTCATARRAVTSERADARRHRPRRQRPAPAGRAPRRRPPAGQRQGRRGGASPRSPQRAPRRGHPRQRPAGRPARPPERGLHGGRAATRSTSSTPRPRAWSATSSSRSWATHLPRTRAWRPCSRRWSSTPTTPRSRPDEVRRPGLRRATAPRLAADARLDAWRPTATAGAASCRRPSRARSSSSRRSGCSSSTACTVICVGGGGIPVVPDGRRRLRGVEAVIDKDLAAALLASASAPRPCCCSPTSPPSTRLGHRRTPGRSTRTERRAAGVRCRPGRWDRRSRPCAGSSEAGGPVAAIGALADAAAILRGERRHDRAVLGWLTPGRTRGG